MPSPGAAAGAHDTAAGAQPTRQPGGQPSAPYFLFLR